MCANLIMPVLAQHFSWTASLTFLAGISVVAGALYLSLRKREAQIVRV